MSDLHTPNPGANIVAILHTGLGGYRVKKAKDGETEREGKRNRQKYRQMEGDREAERE